MEPWSDGGRSVGRSLMSSSDLVMGAASEMPSLRDGEKLMVCHSRSCRGRVVGEIQETLLDNL